MTLREILRKSHLSNEYRRQSALNPIVPGVLKELFDLAQKRKDGKGVQMFVKHMKNASERSQWHFTHSDPNVAAHKSQVAFMKEMNIFRERIQVLNEGAEGKSKENLV